MAVTGTETYNALITDALLDIEAGTLGQNAHAEAMTHGVRHTNRLLKKWQGLGYFASAVTAQSVTLVAATAAHTLSPVRPFRILHAQYKSAAGIETPMIRMSRQEYDELPDKTVTGIPTQFMWDRQKESALFYVWPLKAAVTTETIEITYEREFEDIAADTDTVDLPVEGYDALVLSIAERLAPAYGSEQRKLTIKMDAKQARNEFFATAHEGVTNFFGG